MRQLVSDDRQQDNSNEGLLPMLSLRNSPLYLRFILKIYLFVFSAIFTIKNNSTVFLFASLDNEAIPKGSTLKNTFFSLYEKGGLHNHLQ